MPALLILCLAFDLAAIKLEPNLERRSERAMDNAAAAMDTARDASGAGVVFRYAACRASQPARVSRLMARISCSNTINATISLYFDK